jgi:branched-chain amino acid aminotransferase
VRDGAVATPPASEGALESITLDIIAALCGELGIPFERRPIDRSELLVADEVALVGTLAEVTIAKSIDGLPLGEPRVAAAIARRYRDAVTGIAPHEAADLSRRPRPKRLGAMRLVGELAAAPSGA